jgi:hypothetical protein
LIEENVGAVTRRFDKPPVVKDVRIGVLIARRISATAIIGLADSSSAVDEELVESAAVRTIGLLITEVPFPENAGRVARIAKRLGQCHGVRSEPLSFEDGVGDAIEEFMAAGHQGRSSRRAGG